MTEQLYLKDPIKWVTDSDINEIKTTLNKLAYAYYENEPIVTDTVYDNLVNLVKEYRSYEPPVGYDTDLIKSLNTPEHNMDDTKCPLPYSMYSLNKIKENTSNIFSDVNSILVSDKLDGISAMLCHTRSASGESIIKMYKRSDSSYGRDITPFWLSVKDRPYSKVNHVIRGELILRKSVFEEYKKKHNADIIDPRTTVNGLLSSKTIKHPELYKAIEFIAYEIVNTKSMRIEEQYLHLEQRGFTIPWYVIVNNVNDKYLTTLLDNRRIESPYTVDGIVICKNDKKYPIEQKNPSYAYAFKSIRYEQIIQTTVTSVEWNISKDGLYIPTILINPVVIGTETIKRVSGSNARYIVNNGIGEGAIVSVIRSGDIIPYIHQVIKPATSPDLPPEDSYIWNKTRVHIMTKTLTDDELIKRIKHFFKCINVKGISDATASVFVNNGYKSIPSIFQMSLAQLQELGFKKKAVTLYEDLQKVGRNIKLEDIMHGSNLFPTGVGSDKLKSILDKYPDPNTWTVSNLSRIKGITAVSADNIISKLPLFVNFCKECGFNIVVNETEDEQGIFAGSTFVITGFRDANVIAFIKANGGTVSTGNVNLQTICLIYNEDKETTKRNRALLLGIPVISKTDFITKYNIPV